MAVPIPAGPQPWPRDSDTDPFRLRHTGRVVKINHFPSPLYQRWSGRDLPQAGGGIGVAFFWFRFLSRHKENEPGRQAGTRRFDLDFGLFEKEKS